MSKKKNNQPDFTVSDPLEGLGFDEMSDDFDQLEDAIEDLEEEIDELEAEADELSEELEEMVELDEQESVEELEALDGEPSGNSSFSDILGKVKGALVTAWEAVKKFMQPVTDIASKKLPVKTAALSIGGVALIALVAVIVIFSVVSNATYKSGVTVREWAEAWNSVEYTDHSASDYYGTYSYNFAAMFSDTDHLYLTEEDIKALEKGEEVAVLDDVMYLSAEVEDGNIVSVTGALDYYAFIDKFYEKGIFSYTYSTETGANDAVLRFYMYIGMLYSSMLEDYEGQDGALNCAKWFLNGIYATDEQGRDYTYSGDYTCCISITKREFPIEVSETDLSRTDISPSDLSATDVEVPTEAHVIYKLDVEYTNAGVKKNPADWSWFTNLFAGCTGGNEVAGDDTPTEPDSTPVVTTTDATNSDLTNTDTAE